MERVIRRIWCRVFHKRWIAGTYHPQFYWVCHKCKTRWKPKRKRNWGIEWRLRLVKLKVELIIKRIWGQ